MQGVLTLLLDAGDQAEEQRRIRMMHLYNETRDGCRDLLSKLAEATGRVMAILNLSSCRH